MKELTEVTVHNSAMFLPYHRYFIHLYHKALRENCRYHGTIPYVPDPFLLPEANPRF